MACTNALSVFSCDMPFLPGLVHSRVTDRIFGGDISDCSCATATTLPANNNVPNISPIIRFIGNLLCGLKSRRHSTRNLFFSNVSVSFGVSPPSNRSGVIPKHGALQPREGSRVERRCSTPHFEETGSCGPSSSECPCHYSSSNETIIFNVSPNNSGKGYVMKPVPGDCLAGE